MLDSLATIFFPSNISLLVKLALLATRLKCLQFARSDACANNRSHRLNPNIAGPYARSKSLIRS